MGAEDVALAALGLSSRRFGRPMHRPVHVEPAMLDTALVGRCITSHQHEVMASVDPTSANASAAAGLMASVSRLSPAPLWYSWNSNELA